MEAQQCTGTAAAAASTSTADVVSDVAVSLGRILEPLAACIYAHLWQMLKSRRLLLHKKYFLQRCGKADGSLTSSSWGTEYADFHEELSSIAAIYLAY